MAKAKKTTAKSRKFTIPSAKRKTGKAKKGGGSVRALTKRLAVRRGESNK